MRNLCKHGWLLALLLLTVPACKAKKKELTAKQRCEKGCEFRMHCIEEMALDKSVTAANRAHLRQSQQKSHERFVRFCAKRCVAGSPRFLAFAHCGITSKSCADYFSCESKAADMSPAPRPASRATP